MRIGTAERFDPDDREFAARCAASGAALITNDSHLLDHRDQVGFTVFTPAEFWKRKDDFVAGGKKN